MQTTWQHKLTKQGAGETNQWQVQTIRHQRAGKQTKTGGETRDSFKWEQKTVVFWTLSCSHYMPFKSGEHRTLGQSPAWVPFCKPAPAKLSTRTDPLPAVWTVVKHTHTQSHSLVFSVVPAANTFWHFLRASKATDNIILTVSNHNRFLPLGLWQCIV